MVDPAPDYTTPFVNLAMIGAGAVIASKMIDSASHRRQKAVKKKSKKHRRILRRIKA